MFVLDVKMRVIIKWRTCPIESDSQMCRILGLSTRCRQLSAEGVLSLRPQILVGTEEMGAAADWLLQRAGGHNLATHTGYKPFSNESLVSLDPDVLVFADRALSGDAARAALFKENPILASTRAARSGRIIELDPTLLVGGLGPRLPGSVKTLSDGFYPEAESQ
ncbi:corrinoid ABC transporter substrate-binding protein [compost metagenome]